MVSTTVTVKNGAGKTCKQCSADTAGTTIYERGILNAS
ncbi:hypothetical protein SAMN05216469_11114 [Ruminococcus albus]|uniref:Uncharacterized protein n=1 Tax=Ruminococcus albus TaxID=1264 RepID=A0A1H7M8K4_RUMAL|nr:hypothetical protein SAMN05216469_11114 [Ruminococcus albus]